ncbi:unnamed protein product [Mytilus coruscus]|uniref:Uncharacterized protein n=1 Tax=Mytilus coruscus TaxID=42192 RepID=A0A6J8D715_MYTCO|nr:unnamed protein product [Mytilus coruscus]
MQRRLDNFFTHKNFDSTIISTDTQALQDATSIQNLESQTSSNNDFACSSTSSPNVYGPSYPDIGTLAKEDLRKDEVVRLKLLSTKSEDPKFQFPTRTLRETGRACQLSWLIDNPWLKYSVSLDALYCAPCVLFGSQRSDTKEKTFGFQSPCTDWINVGRSISRHLQQGSSEEFIRIRSGKSQDILQSLSTSYNQVVIKNRNILKSIIEVILLCSKQNLALRSHSEKDSNFIAILHDKAKGNEVLANHLAYCDPRTKYTSPDIQNELIMLWCGSNTI